MPPTLILAASADEPEPQSAPAQETIWRLARQQRALTLLDALETALGLDIMAELESELEP